MMQKTTIVNLYSCHITNLWCFKCEPQQGKNNQNHSARSLLTVVPTITTHWVCGESTLTHALDLHANLSECGNILLTPKQKTRGCQTIARINNGCLNPKNSKSRQLENCSQSQGKEITNLYVLNVVTLLHSPMGASSQQEWTNTTTQKVL